MDFSYPLTPELYVVPRGTPWNHIQTQYSFMGIGQNISPLVFADGVNEKGFAAAVLYFPGYASYDSISSRTGAKPTIPAIEIVRFLLSLCPTTDRAISLLNNIQIVGTEDSVTHTVAPLHWMIADQSGTCLVIEKMADGLHILENPIGVLSNSPDFLWHMTNLRGYMNVTPRQNANTKWNSVTLSPFGQGAGTFGLPGDYTPPSRFVRTAYQKTHAAIPADSDEAALTCFHLMESVSIPRGVVTTDRETHDYTQYTAFMNLNRQEYYFTTYENSHITKSGLNILNRPIYEVTSLGKLAVPADFMQR